MATGIETVTLFVADLDSAKSFYRDTLGLPVVFEDADSVVVAVGVTLVNLLVDAAARQLIEPAVVAGPEAGHRFQLTVRVADVDAAHADLCDRGVTFLTGPVDQPWGRRTASFLDPDGHLWELAQELPGSHSS